MNDKNNILISIICPIYNSEKYLKECIESIINQTFIINKIGHVELILVDDASTDQSYNICKYYQTKYKDSAYLMINLIQLQQHNGIVNALNYAINISKGVFIARMDSDDYSLPDRLLIQYNYLINNNDIDIIGTQADIIYDDMKNDKECNNMMKPLASQIRSIQLPCQSILVHWDMLFYCTIIHPSIFARRKIFTEYKYRNKYLYCEDYDLWLRIILTSPYKMANIPNILLRLRKHKSSTSFMYYKEQQQHVHQCLYDHIKSIDIISNYNIDLSIILALRHPSSIIMNQKLKDHHQIINIFNTCINIIKTLHQYIIKQFNKSNEEHLINNAMIDRIGEMVTLLLGYYHNISAAQNLYVNYLSLKKLYNVSS